MTHSNNDIDDKIRQALLADEDLADFESTGEQNIFAQLFELFKGRQRWLNVLGAILQLIYLGLAIWTAIRFFEADTVRDQILFATGFLASVGITMAFKIWFWMVMNRNSVLREIKRLELQVARLGQG